MPQAPRQPGAHVESAVVDLTLADPLVGRVLDGRYRIDARIAEGGMGTVYTATDTRLDRTVAVKVMQSGYAADPAFVARFTSEARAAARLSHPNVVAVFDQGSEPAGRGGPAVVFLVMEYVAGATLRQLLNERGQLAAEDALTLLEPILSALAAAHAARLVHRDVKPENVLLARDGTVKVADFGLARAVEASASTASVTMLIGTVAYLAPEQVTTGAADARTDVYAAGILLYELLTGRPPFDGTNAMAVAFRHVHEDVPRPSLAVRAVPRQVDELIGLATARDPARRFADAREFLGALRHVRARLPADGGRRWRPAASRGATPPAVSLPVASPRLEDQPAGAGTGQTGTRPVRNARTTAPNSPAAPTQRVDGARPTAVVVPELPAEVRPRGRRGGRRLGGRLTGRRGGRKSLLVLLTLALVSAVAGWWLMLGRYTPAPSLLNKTKAGAASALTAAGLQARWGPEVYSDSIRTGRVAYESPGAGERVRHSGTVDVALSKGPEVHKLPALTGASLAAAQQSLAAIRLRNTVRGAYSDTVATGALVGTAPKAGAELHPGDLVTLTVSRGRAPITVPDVTSTPFDTASTALTKLDFTITRSDAFSDTIPTGKVISTTPAAGRTAPHATAISVVVSKGPQLFPIPDVRRLSAGDAAGTLRAAGLKVRTFQPFGFGRVHVVSPKVGTMVARGTTVSIIVY